MGSIDIEPCSQCCISADQAIARPGVSGCSPKSCCKVAWPRSGSAMPPWPISSSGSQPFLEYGSFWRSLCSIATGCLCNGSVATVAPEDPDSSRSAYWFATLSNYFVCLSIIFTIWQASLYPPLSGMVEGIIQIAVEALGADTVQARAYTRCWNCRPGCFELTLKQAPLSTCMYNWFN